MSYQPKSYRKFLATSVTAAVVTTAVATGASAATVETQNTTQFSDVSSSYFAAGEIYRLVEKEIISGYPDGTFKPGQNINRGQAATLLVKAAGLEIPESVTDRPFSDVSVENNFAAVLTAMKDAGFIGGYSDGTYRAGAEITREQMASILVRTFALENTGADVEVADLASAHASHQDNIVILAQNGITQVENFRPKESVTRAQFATFVDRALTNQYTEELGLSGIEFVDTNTVEVAFDRVLTAEEVAEMTFAFSPELEVTAQELKTAEVSSSDAGSVVVLTTADQDPEQDYRLWVNGERTTLEGTGSAFLPEPTPGDELVVESVTAIDATTISVLFEGMEEAVVIELDEELVDGDNEVTFTYNEQEFTVTVSFEAPVEEGLVVESVSAITTTEVEVKVSAATEDVLGFTVEVKDSKGNVVEVKPVDVSEGDTEITFEFKTAVDAEELTGIWTVDGVEFNFTVIEQFEAILEAAQASPLNQVVLLNALEAAGIKNVDSDKLSEYADAIVDAQPENLKDIQDAINEANKTDEEKAAEAAAVKAVADARNQVQLLAALQSNFDRINSDWIVAYAEADILTGTSLLALTAEDDGVTFDAVQKLIDDVNKDKVEVAVSKANLSLDAKLVADARALVLAYIADGEEDELTDKDYALDGLEIEDALIAVNRATTNNSLKNALVRLDSLENSLLKKYEGTSFDTKTDDFDIDTVKDNLLAKYREAIREASVENKNQRSDIQAIITQVNNAEADALLTNVTSANNADELLKALKAYPNLKGVADINKAVYFSEDFSAVTASDIQAKVNTSNIVAIGTATTGSEVLAKLNVLELKNVVSANQVAYLDAKTSLAAESNAAAVDTALKGINDQLAESAAVKAINDATTATEVKSALDTLAITEYLNVTSADRIFIAEQVLEARDEVTSPVAKEFANKTAVAAAVSTATGARTTAIDGVNNLKVDDSLTNIANVLLAVGHPSLTGEVGAPTAGDTLIADAFITSLTFKDGEVDPQFRSISAIRAAITAAQ
ncbi:S-layer homology domain-containing protein [Alkalihalophilus pseudofirmus]|uniref:S-layer homology domain-containing protein n=1 Tax=Alkalihalophilus pseudofirmus TaxID=79885 RepID=A0AAJ2U1B3_ALKPS|nr:S-layer homology domain-containing protein [Alkalihalophilus pseudofirmus]MDV2886379.1 S-layer homology domain-containing protein [Alkalihalophilus pseudofirmus]